jgi:hypothetical protein
MRSVGNFEQSTAVSSLWLFLGNYFTPKLNCRKIVAFGAGPLGYAREKEDTIVNGSLLAAQTKHAALYSIRRKLQIIYRHEIPVYLHDSEYTLEDKKATEKLLDMKVVNGAIGFGEGWIHLDRSTVVFDFRCLNDFPPLYQIIFEITRPLAIFSIQNRVKKHISDEEWAVWSYKLIADKHALEEKPSRKRWSEIIPGYGM